jgi:hypothetical protein
LEYALEEASLAAGLSFTSGGEWASTTTSNVAERPVKIEIQMNAKNPKAFTV